MAHNLLKVAGIRQATLSIKIYIIFTKMPLTKNNKRIIIKRYILTFKRMEVIEFMKTSFKYLVATSVISISLLATAVPGFADTALKASGGWSESGGYYINQARSTGVGIFASDSPDKHYGERRTKTEDHGETVFYAAYGYTIWKDTYHYTTARMEDNKGNVRTTSGRQWGTGYTEAQSPWYAPGIFENTEARTYWGH
ncbi:hypothetical protein [Paenibacillus barengoltzii]|uniref:hypothetical protein n=1 Tax=Paenibacillus barengoltzii TaxID=343517 RepID=UPI001431C970|nr:hypothetical protein [Paenibacillus barengoltzii]